MALFPLTVPETDFRKTNKLIYSFPKVGKTTFASFMTDGPKVPLFIMTEDGEGALSLSKVKVTNWEGFRRLITQLETNKARLAAEHTCIVLDLVSDLDSWCANWLCEQKRIEYIGDLEHGKGWKLQREAFQAQITKLLALLPVTFICHSQEKEITWNGEKIKVQAPNLSKGALEYINGKVDVIMWVSPASSGKSTPTISMRPTTTAIAGTRQKSLAKDYVYDPRNPRACYEAILHDYATAQTAAAPTVETKAPAAPAADKGVSA